MNAPFDFPHSFQLTPPGCLPAWQSRRIREYIEANLSQRLTTQGIAQVVNLSASHFSRAFVRSFGSTVHHYVMHRRIALAQRLMLGTSDELSRIALSCGMSDQSHLTRWFRRVIGETPAAWRRARPHPLRGATDTAQPAEVEIVTGPTVFFAVTKSKGVPVAHERLLAKAAR